MNGYVLGKGGEANQITGKVHQLHLRLFWGRPGGEIVSWAAMLLIFLSASGLVLMFAVTAVVIHWEDEARKVVGWITRSGFDPEFPGAVAARLPSESRSGIRKTRRPPAGQGAGRRRSADRILVCVVSLILPVMAVTGPMIWLKKRGSGRPQNGRYPSHR